MLIPINDRKDVKTVSLDCLMLVLVPVSIVLDFPRGCTGDMHKLGFTNSALCRMWRQRLGFASLGAFTSIVTRSLPVLAGILRATVNPKTASRQQCVLSVVCGGCPDTLFIGELSVAPA